MNILDQYTEALTENKQMKKRFYSLKTNKAREKQNNELIDHGWNVVMPLIDTILDKATHVEINAFPVDHAWKEGGWCVRGTYPISQVKGWGSTSISLETKDGKDLFYIDLADNQVNVNFYILGRK